MCLQHADQRVPTSVPLLAVLTHLPLRQSWDCGPLPQPCLTLGVGIQGRGTLAVGSWIASV